SFLSHHTATTGVYSLSLHDALPIYGNVTLPSNRSYDTYLTFSQAFEAGRFGLERLGVYAYIGERPTFSLTSAALSTAAGNTIAIDRKSTRLNSSHVAISYAVFCLKK